MAIFSRCINSFRTVKTFITFISGCIMASVNHYGEDIDTINNVTDYIECNQLCNERDECFIWTYVEGECYAKTQNTFKVRSADVIGGYKDCKSSKREI